MKSDQVTKHLKELFSVATNDDILPAVQSALGAKATPPLGATVYVSGGQLFPPAIFGLSNPPKLAEIETLQSAFRKLADLLDRDKAAMIRAEVMAGLNNKETELE